MTFSYYADRVNLVHAMRRFPHWSAPQLAHALQCWESWVKKWRKRLRPFLSQPTALAFGVTGTITGAQPSACEAGSTGGRGHPLHSRCSPGRRCARTPGPKAIQYYLQRDETLLALGLARSRSTRTIYQVLVKHQRVVPRKAARTGANGAARSDDALANRLQGHFQCSRGCRWKEAARRPILHYRGHGNIESRCCSCER